MAWIVRLVKTGADSERQCADVLKINRPDDLGDIYVAADDTIYAFAF